MPAMFWSAIIAGVCGGLAAVVGRLLIRDTGRRRVHYAAVVAVVFIILNTASRTLVLPHIRVWQARSDAQRYLANDRLFSLLVAQHPEVGESFTSLMVDLARTGASSEQASARAFEMGRSMLTTYFVQYAPRASSTSLVGYVTSMVEVLGDLKTNDPESCYYFLFGQGTEGASTLSVLSQEQKNRMTGSMTDVLESAIRNPEHSPEKPEGARLLEELIGRLAATHDEEFMSALQALANPRDPAADRGELCTVTLEMYREVLKWSEPQRTILLRHLFAEGA